jgi:hypothetical protein
MPQNASLTFTSAATLYKKAVDLERQMAAMQSPKADGTVLADEKFEEPVKPKSAKKALVAKKPLGTKANEEGESTKIRKPRKSRAKIVDGETSADAIPKEKPARRKKSDLKEKSEVEKNPTPEQKAVSKERAPRKPRAKKDVGDRQAKIAKGRVTKASGGTKKDGENSTMAKSVTKEKRNDDNDCSTSAIRESVATSEPPLDDEDLLLPEAAKRRANWTPPKPTDRRNDFVTPVVDHSVLHSIPDDEAVETQNFANLLGSFSYNNDLETVPAVFPSASTSTRKRKRIELIKTNMPATADPDPAVKAKTVKKKPRTITDLATSAYRTVEDQESMPRPAPLLQYFPSGTDDAALSEPRTLDGFKIPRKPRAKSPVKSAARGSKTKKSQPELPKLFSPQSALKQVEKQNFVFGTSSQLAREDSPTLLRDIQQAMLESNQVGTDPFDDVVDGLELESPQACFIGTNGTVFYPAKRNLWSASSHGDLTAVETVDLTKTPKALDIKQPFVTADNAKPPTESNPTPEDEEWHHLDETPIPKAKASEHSVAEAGPTARQIARKSLSEELRPSKEMGTSSMKAKSTIAESPSKATRLPDTSGSNNMPDYGSYPTVRLAKELASYRFKPIKSRDAMILLLEKCWKGKQRVALEPLGTNRALSTSPVKSQGNRKPAIEPVGSPQRGRQQRDSSTKKSLGEANLKPITSSAIEEVDLISDSDTPLSVLRTPKRKAQKQAKSQILEDISDSDTPRRPRLPRRRNSKLGSPPNPLELASENDSILTPTSRQVDLNERITRAITSAPPSNDPSKPTWHEKMLLYDPIVLEDLTVWLNTGALQKVGWDGEVEPKEVKAWCLGKSVCCLWRENLRGGARSRY